MEGKTMEEKKEESWLDKRNAYIFDFAIETWIDALKDFTPRTSIVKLSLQGIFGWR
jgi:hypothetical protein